MGTVRQAPVETKAIVFDLFETLITEYDPQWTPRPSVADQLGVNAEIFNQIWGTIYQDRMQGTLPDFPTALGYVCKKMGHNPNPDLISSLTQSRITEKMKLFDEIDETILNALSRFQKTGIKIGLISNAAPEEVLGWQASALSPFFDVTLFSYKVGLCKPDIEIYHLACNHLGISPQQAIFVGDGASDELIGAEVAGMYPLWGTWFIDRWPNPHVWPQEKRAAYDRTAQFPRVRHVLDLVDIVGV